jgi:hypothetical protein
MGFNFTDRVFVHPAAFAFGVGRVFNNNAQVLGVLGLYGRGVFAVLEFDGGDN